MLVTLAAKCVAGLAAGLRKKFASYAGHVSPRVQSEETINYLLVFVFIVCVCVVGANHFGEVQGEEGSGGSGAAGSFRCSVSFCEYDLKHCRLQCVCLIVFLFYLFVYFPPLRRHLRK